MVSIVILSYNTKTYLHACLSSLFKHVKEDVEVIVVDNASSDESAKMVKGEFKRVKIIENKTNVGFAAGNNIGVKQAKGEYILFLNSDTEFENDAVGKLVHILREKKDVAVVGGNLKNTTGTYQQAFGKFYTLQHVFTTLFLGDNNEKSKTTRFQEGYVNWVTGACMLIRRKEFLDVQGFDETYFMYVEDMDLCYRLQKIGLRTYFLPIAEVLHVGQGSSNREFAIVNIYKGILYFYKQHKPYWQYCIVKLALYAKAFILIVFGTAVNNSNLRNTYRKAIQF